MINISPERLPQNLIQLDEGIKEHLEFGEKCKEFFSSYRKLKLTDEGCLSPADCYNNLESFSEMYHQISDGYVEKCESDYNRLENEAMLLESMAALTIEEVNKNEEYTSRLIEIKKKVDLCKNIDDVFCKGVIKLFREAPQTLQYMDALFFLPTQGGVSGTIGECHCDPSRMGRKSRTSFSKYLCREISGDFSKTKPLTIASIGAGLCFHELEIHALITQSGYSVERWVIVEPYIFDKTIANFKTILKWENRKVEVLTESTTCDKYFKKIKEGSCTIIPDIFLFIDIDLVVFGEQIDSARAILNQSAAKKGACVFAEFKARGIEDFSERTEFNWVEEKT